MLTEILQVSVSITTGPARRLLEGVMKRPAPAVLIQNKAKTSVRFRARAVGEGPQSSAPALSARAQTLREMRSQAFQSRQMMPSIAQRQATIHLHKRPTPICVLQERETLVIHVRARLGPLSTSRGWRSPSGASAFTPTTGLTVPLSKSVWSPSPARRHQACVQDELGDTEEDF